MRYWDSSALVALHIEQKETAQVRDLYARDPEVLTWVLSDVEVRSGIVRLGRDGAMNPAEVQTAIARVETFWESVHEISLVEAVKPRAKRLLRDKGLHLPPRLLCEGKTPTTKRVLADFEEFRPLRPAPPGRDRGR